MCVCHETYGAHLRAKNLNIGYCQSWRGLDKSAQDHMESEVEAYRNARREGIQPAGSTTQQVRYAIEQSDKFGKAFDASKPLAHLPED